MHISASSVLTAGLAIVGQANASPCPPQIKPIKRIELGPRPYFLVNNMTDGPLKSKLESCKEMEIKPSKFSIGHRGGAPLQFPEHSQESNLAGARMGAGVLECDVAFTKDRQLVCRHSQCDLHTTTNIVNVPELNAKCTKPFQPAKDGKPASAKCCTSDITRDEFKSLCAKMDGFNASATNPKDFLGGTPNWRTDLYATCGKVMDHKEHIKMVESLGLQHTPELKAPEVEMPFEGNYTKDMYALQMIDNYKKAGVPASRVFAQSFQPDVVRFWLKHEPAFGKTAILLDESGDDPALFPQSVKNLTTYAKDGVTTIAPPMYYLIQVKDGKMVASDYAKKAKELGLKIVSWSLERSPPLAVVHAKGDYYYTSVKDVVKKDGDMYTYVDALVKEGGVSAMFSDWSATVTYYANCFGIGI